MASGQNMIKENRKRKLEALEGELQRFYGDIAEKFDVTENWPLFLRGFVFPRVAHRYDVSVGDLVQGTEVSGGNMAKVRAVLLFMLSHYGATSGIGHDVIAQWFVGMKAEDVSAAVAQIEKRILEGRKSEHKAICDIHNHVGCQIIQELKAKQPKHCYLAGLEIGERAVAAKKESLVRAIPFKGHGDLRMLSHFKNARLDDVSLFVDHGYVTAAQAVKVLERFAGKSAGERLSAKGVWDYLVGQENPVYVDAFKLAKERGMVEALQNEGAERVTKAVPRRALRVLAAD